MSHTSFHLEASSSSQGHKKKKAYFSLLLCVLEGSAAALWRAICILGPRDGTASHGNMTSCPGRKERETFPLEEHPVKLILDKACMRAITWPWSWETWARICIWTSLECWTWSLHIFWFSSTRQFAKITTRMHTHTCWEAQVSLQAEGLPRGPAPVLWVGRHAEAPWTGFHCGERNS